jgi:hypothetical protein
VYPPHVAASVDLEDDVALDVARATTAGPQFEIRKQERLIEEALFVVGVDGDGLALSVDPCRPVEGVVAGYGAVASA